MLQPVYLNFFSAFRCFAGIRGRVEKIEFARLEACEEEKRSEGSSTRIGAGKAGRAKHSQESADELRERENRSKERGR